ncbi:hypothetical protein C5167_013596 [Papaver somniferum]|uniref:Uncharacterized protein n=1 Tax=Papaver somniferum TaxID=3469 RepID=A0A4Y7J4T0_PAPSO|nr:hypothetical protein C5167_013596 [Papaver somniferum]
MISEVYKIDGVAMWFINGVVAAFFGSLERCSCINIDTKEEDDNGINANDLPLIYNDGNSRRENRTTIVGSGKKRGGLAHEEHHSPSVVNDVVNELGEKIWIEPENCRPGAGGTITSTVKIDLSKPLHKGGWWNTATGGVSWVRYHWERQSHTLSNAYGVDIVEDQDLLVQQICEASQQQLLEKNQDVIININNKNAGKGPSTETDEMEHDFIEEGKSTEKEFFHDTDETHAVTDGFSLDIMDSSNNMIHAIVENDPSKGEWFLSCVYGDLNITIDPQDRNSQSPSSTPQEVIKVINKASLMDMKFSGNPFTWFSNKHGQLINFNKSEVYFSSNMSPSSCQTFSGILQVREMNLKEEQYLGLPFFVGRNRKVPFGVLQENMNRRFTNWNASNMSEAAHSVTIRNVSNAIPIYHMQSFKLPEVTINKMNISQQLFFALNDLSPLSNLTIDFLDWFTRVVI